ncbi:MAG: class I tRNA ligase family protein, partial [Patescibacteria group bacterium]|nr:class I tRNA ligase family protein [Patescibacteria group bacterium]
FDFEVPILEDDKADPEKGTGLVMCCTFGDQMDMEWQKKHKLPIKEAINKFGKMTDLAGKYSGQKIKDARVHILHDMNELGLLKEQKEISHAVNVHERCGTPIEFIHSKQWFIKYLDLKEDMMKWGEEFTWHPKYMKNRYDNWVKGLAWDWCISRQLPFGIPFPVWYCKDCDEVIIAKEEDLPVDPTIDKAPVDACPKCGCKEFVPENDIINTWATSSLTPTIVTELFKDKPVYKKLKNNPFDFRPQGHDIISFWLFNTVVKSHLHYEMSPWKNAFINGWMLDPKGKKMSKSKGNVVEPREMIKKYSADALRFMSASSTLGEDLPFPEKDIAAGKKTVMKIFNASKFVHIHLEDYDVKTDIAGTNLQAMDKWMLQKLNETITEATEQFDKFHFFKAKASIDKFFWKVLCDNYLEIVKDRLYQPEINGDDLRLSAQATLYHTLLAVLKLYSPFVPFVTEEVYSWHYKQYVVNGDQGAVESIHISSWPKLDVRFNFEQDAKAGDLAIKIISAVRKIKSQEHLSQKHEVLKLTIPCTEEEKSLLETVVEAIKRTISAKEIIINADAKESMSEEVILDCELAPKKEKEEKEV